MATIIDGKKRIPFRRGMLISYLIQRGFAYEEAENLANGVREALSKKKSIQKKEIVQLIQKHIRREFGENGVGDLVFWERTPTSITVEHKTGSRSFSKDFLAHSLQPSGLLPEQALQLASEIGTHLIDQHITRLTNQELGELAVSMLVEQYDSSYAKRYKVWRAWGELDKPLVILIGGASGVGKTSLAVNLASVLEIPRVVATDDIRQIMRLTLAPELMPSIHGSSYTAWADMPVDHSRELDPVVAGFREQAKVVSVGVRAIISRCIEENSSVIIDGVHLLSDFIDEEEYSKSAFLVSLCLALEDRQSYEERFARRAVAAPSRFVHKYLDHLEEILKIQQHIMEAAAAYDIPIIDAESLDDVTSAAVMVVIEHLQKQDEFRQVSGNKKRKKAKPRTKKI